MSANTSYAEFIASKRAIAESVGFIVKPDDLHAALFPFQRSIVAWALKRGRAAIFADTGLGKTLMQLEWARHVCSHTDGSVLILAPLAVAQQTAREAEKLDLAVTICRTQDDVQPGVNITNYEMLSHFDPSAFSGLVLDESSILKSFDGKTRKALIAFADTIPLRLS